MKTNIILLSVLLALLILLIPGSALGWSPYGYGPPWAVAGGDMPHTRAMRLERRADQDNYYLTLHLTGMAPQEVNVTLEGGRWLNISSDDRSESSHQQSSDQGGYYYSRSFSYSSNRSSRRISLPRDADGAAMQRVDGENRVEISIPRQR